MEMRMKRIIENAYVRVIYTQYEFDESERGWDADLFSDDGPPLREINIIPLHPDDDKKQMNIKLDESKKLDKFINSIFCDPSPFRVFQDASDAVMIWNFAHECELVKNKIQYKLYAGKYNGKYNKDVVTTKVKGEKMICVYYYRNLASMRRNNRTPIHVADSEKLYNTEYLKINDCKNLENFTF